MRNCARSRTCFMHRRSGGCRGWCWRPARPGWEFEKYLAGLVEDVWWHRGRCLSYGDGIAFWALAEMVRQRLGVAEEDPADVAAGKLAAGLAEFIPDPAERA